MLTQEHIIKSIFIKVISEDMSVLIKVISEDMTGIGCSCGGCVEGSGVVCGCVEVEVTSVFAAELFACLSIFIFYSSFFVLLKPAPRAAPVAAKPGCDPDSLKKTFAPVFSKLSKNRRR